MEGTYIPLGTTLSFSFAVVMAILSAMPLNWLIRRKGPVFMWQSIAVGGLWLLVGALGIPMTIGMGLSFMVMAVGFFVGPNAIKGPLVAKVGLAGILFATAASVAWIGALPGDRVTLSADHLTYHSFDGTHTVPREGLRVNALKRKTHAWYAPDSWSWTTFSGRGGLGPHIMGSMLYYGPHGFATGDQVGKDLAAWAQTETKYTVR